MQFILSSLGVALVLSHRPVCHILLTFVELNVEVDMIDEHLDVNDRSEADEYENFDEYEKEDTDDSDCEVIDTIMSHH